MDEKTTAMQPTDFRTHSYTRLAIRGALRFGGMVVLATVSFCAPAGAQVQQSWLARYNGIDAAGVEDGYAIAIDAGHNVFVFGPSISETSDGNSALIKYDPNGQQLWVARDSQAYPNYAIPSSPAGKRSLIVDAAGNAYVTGVYWPATNNSPDIMTAKYDANGHKVWSALFNSASDYSYDAPSALAVDASGNVCVAGFAGGIAGTEDFVVLQYGTNGTLRWQRRYNGTGNSQDIPAALAVDASGNVYVTGWSFSSSNRQDYLTIKYDAAGNGLWTNHYDGAFHSEDSPTALAIDTAGNVYVTGCSLC